jgi:hypothetical protein
LKMTGTPAVRAQLAPGSTGVKVGVVSVRAAN